MLSALGDFQLALSAADFLCQADEDERYSLVELRRFRCFEQTAIISYARPFTRSNGSLPRLSLKHCGVKLSIEEKELHERILQLRNKLVAHSDQEMMNFASKAYETDLETGKPFHLLVAQHDEGLQFCSFHDQAALIDLIRKVLVQVYKTLHQIAQTDPSALEMIIHFPTD